MKHLLSLLAFLAFFCEQLIAAAAPRKTTEMVAMRDGVHLATDIFLPQGQGPFPVVLERTPYNRKAKSNQAAQFVNNGYVFVIQDWRGLFDSEGKFTVDQLTATKGGQDGYDTVEWIARQPWSNGKVGVTGASGPGIAAKQTVLSNPPHLLAAVTSVASIHPDDRVFQNGGVVQEQSDRWLAARGAEIMQWPRPRPFAFGDSHSAWPRDRRGEAVAGRIAVLDHSGWYDSSCTPSFDDFVALQGKHNRLVMLPKAHGSHLSGELKYRQQNPPGTSAMGYRQ